MSQEKYIGMDVHQATISVAVKNAEGKLLMECVLETKAATILEFIQGLRGTLALTFEEGTMAAWLHSSYERGCQEKILSPPLGRRCGLHPAPARFSSFLEGSWFYRFGSPRSSAAMSAPADPDLMVSWPWRLTPFSCAATQT